MQRNSPQLQRELRLFGATMMGLGSILGTGIFVSVGIAANVAGPLVIPAIAVAAAIALCNAFSSAQLAAVHPTSGGTYEYAYERLNPLLGFTAGWMFLCAKTASAATAALGFSGYLLHMLEIGDRRWLTPVAVLAAVTLTLLVLGGMRRSNAANIAIVSVTITALVMFVAFGWPDAQRNASANLTPFIRIDPDGSSALARFLHGCALMFVAFTGYGRIATLGEEVREPRRTIPRAIVATIIVSALLYLGVGFVAVASFGADELGAVTQLRAAPLEIVAMTFAYPFVARIVAIGAITAMLGVLLNLILGLSRVLLAMGRRRDMPASIARLNASQTTPIPAVIAVGMAIAVITMLGDVRLTWSFSAFTVLIYYALTNLAALRLKPHERFHSPAFAWTGLLACLFLAMWVDQQVWLTGLAMLAVGWLWHAAARRLRKRADQRA